MTPAVAKAIVAPDREPSNRVQAIDSDLLDLILRDGKKLKLELGGTVIPTPSLTRTMDGASSIAIPIYDADNNFLRTSLAAEDWNAEIDGLWFRYLGVSGALPALTITLEDREVSKIREFEGPLKVLAHRGKPNETTRAEFVKRLVEEANPHLIFVCPQLHDQQPIETERQAKKAQGESKANRGKGIGDTKGLVFKGQAPTSGQRDLAEMALQIAASVNAPFICRVALIAALIDETDMGLVQRGNVLAALEPYTQVRNAAEEISGFLTGKPTWTGTTAIGYHRENPSAPFYEIAQAVQKSATEDGSNYAAFGDEARAWVEAWDGGAGETGGGAGGTKTVKEPRSFEVKKGEDYWTAIQRLAKEVNWRAFVVGSRFYFIDELELARGMVRLAIDKDTEGIEEIEVDYNRNKPVTEFKFKALAKQWKPPVGSVVTVADYGPLSVGFGDAPVKANDKGQAIGISSNRNAKTGEGRARYLVASIEAPLTEASDARKVTITLKKPTAPLPEKSAQTKSVSGNPNAPLDPAAAGENGMGVYAGTAEDVVNEVVFYAQKNGFPDISPASVKAANAEHGPTVDGTRSDHQGPPATAWAADISNGYTTPEETHLAAAIAKAFGIPWDGAGLVTHEEQGYRLQLIYKTLEGGDHYTHVHFGCEVV